MPDLEVFIKTVGYVGIFSIVFAETGLLVGFFLPGDSLLFTTGFIASQGYLDIRAVCALLFLAAVLGDSTGYAFGHRVGKRLFRRSDSFFFHKDHLIRAKNFYDKHGGKTIILARFMPLIRTFAPIVAGMGDMPYVKFLSYNIVGAFLWAVGLPLAGFYLGKTIPDVDRYLLPIIAAIILISIAPGIYQAVKTKEQRAQLRVVFVSLIAQILKK
ncbi:MAG: VTT domain-containing protein [Candidatus Levybacteria bacterium]|nr:VTT domain-containing protein [Candidatus Levybacteria bacterium]